MDKTFETLIYDIENIYYRLEQGPLDEWNLRCVRVRGITDHFELSVELTHIVVKGEGETPSLAARALREQLIGHLISQKRFMEGEISIIDNMLKVFREDDNLPTRA